MLRTEAAVLLCFLDGATEGTATEGTARSAWRQAGQPRAGTAGLLTACGRGQFAGRQGGGPHGEDRAHPPAVP